MKILLVDDEPTVLRMAKIALERGGYDVVTAPSAEDALRICDELGDKLDLVVSDISMPGTTGREFANCVAQLPHPVPVVLMSGYAHTSPILEGLKEGRVDKLRFLAKPFKAKDLLDVVSLSIAESSSGSGKQSGAGHS